MLTGMVSAVFITGSAVAQVKKPAVKKPATSLTAAKPATAVKSASTANLASERDSLSYSIGVSIAQNIKQQGPKDVNTALIAQGLDDVLKGGNTLLTMDQVQQVIQSYYQKQMAVRNAEAVKVSAENKKTGDAFLATNKTKPGVVTTNSGLQYLIEKEGTGAKPTATDRVKVHYTGRLLDGTEFDSSVKRGQPAEFGVNEVIKGWTEALQLMPVGSKWKLYIPSELAYGDRGAGADIKPGSTLVFDVELLDIVKQ